MGVTFQRFIIYVRKPVNVSNLKPIKKGKNFFTFLPTGNNLFNEFTIVCIKIISILNILTIFFLIIPLAICRIQIVDLNLKG